MSHLPQPDPARSRIWAIVPAAGIGRRMQSSVPKQYLELLGKPVLTHTLQRLLDVPAIAGLAVSLQGQDTGWEKIKLATDKPLIRTAGGKERCHSVLNALNGLNQLGAFNAETDWVMVHDAVRPCVREADIHKLIAEVGNKTDGGILALPVRDTMKRQLNDTTRVAQTVDRDGLWHALTPQYFPRLLLKQALESAISQGYNLTDESSAMEYAGYSPRLVAGHEDNIKITRPHDLQLAGLYLESLHNDKAQ